MTTKRHITVISPRDLLSDKGYSPLQYLTSEYEIESLFLNKIPEIYPFLSDPTFSTKAIVLDIDALYEQESVAAWDLINTVLTLIKSTVCRDEVGKTNPRDTIIVGGVCISTDIKLIKDFLSLNDKVCGLFPIGNEFELEEKREAMMAVLRRDYYVPPKILSMLKPKKLKIASKEIKLTPRQIQVLTLIQERGASNKVIAKILKISESTVKLHVGQVIKKYGVKNRTQLALFSKSKN